LLWDTPPGLELVLRQEGVAFRTVPNPHALAFQAGRFVLFDGRRVSASTVCGRLSSEHVAIDVDCLRRDSRVDPFAALVDNRGAAVRWEIGGVGVVERVSRWDKAALRRQVVDRLRRMVTAAGGVWTRLAAFPFPYRSAFNFRADLDETCVRDYARFSTSRRPLADCTTHFVSTRAYAGHPSVMRDLRRLDTQSHGHHHVVYRNPEANRKNLAHADRLLRVAGIVPTGFAAPHGRWNAGLDRVIEDLGYLYSSDFQVGHDDLPFFPWRGGRFSRVLQVPIHPICEGLFLDAGEGRGGAVAEHLAHVVRAKIAAFEPAFVYGHPEGRLARHPEILDALAEAVAGEDLLWRVTLTEFADWWLWRGQRVWSLVPRAEGRLEVQFDEWDTRFPLGLEVVRGRHVATFPLDSSRTTLRLEDLAYAWAPAQADIPPKQLVPSALSLRSAIRSALDWETTTPVEELPVDTLSGRLKKGLRVWRDARRGRPQGPHEALHHNHEEVMQ
jgi:peptidoglycan/xylan/chitin deacetylase (PgdA/CDA1 family)